MKPAFSMWIIGCMCLLLTQHTVVASPSIEHYPHYFDGKPTPPQQKTPHFIGYNCEKIAETFAESFATEKFKANVPHTLSQKQLSWSFLHKRDSNLPVLREIYLFTFINPEKTPLNILVIIDSTHRKGGCPLDLKLYRVLDDVDKSNDKFVGLEKDDGSRHLVQYSSSSSSNKK